MSSALAQRSFAGKAVRATPAPATRGPRCQVVVRATSEESRRAVLGSFLASAAALTAFSANAIDIKDDRKARKNGFDIIYEARDLDLPQAQRDGMSQFRNDVGAAKKRLSESKKRIESDLEPLIAKSYWPAGREELRRQVGTLRFDINSIADTLPKDARKGALAAKKDLLAEIESLDFALRKKNSAAAVKELADTKAALDAVLAKLG